MKYIATLLLSLSLTGCLYQTVNSHDIERARIKCASLGESVEAIGSYFTGNEQVKCSPSGKVHDL